MKLDFQQIVQHYLRNERETSKPRRDQIGRLQIVLWVLWTLGVVATGVTQWYRAIIQHHAVNTIGLIIHCSFVGVFGLIALTWLEMLLEPWRFQ